MSRTEQFARLAQLLTQQRWAALATIDGAGAPMASMVGYVMSDEFDGAVLHLSRLAAHTRNLLANPRAALAVSEPDSGSGDPQRLPRASLQGTVESIGRESLAYPACRAAYLQRLPDSAQLFDFSDFLLFRLVIEEIRFVGGFGQAFTYRREDWRKAPRS